MSQVNNAQALHRNTNNDFAGDMSTLALGLPVATANYTYTISGGGDTAGIEAQAANSAMKGYHGGNAFFKDGNSNSVIATVGCEADQAGNSAPGYPSLSSAATTLAGAAACGSNFSPVK
ncbi:type IV pilin-like G/H family protein [Chroococcidiopsis sp. CCNUC1]|nr:type IV pilin-like G/H family protein [Chroococcidiopsis sp. CCNUC1]